MKRRTLNSLLAFFFEAGFGFAPSIVEAAVTSCDVLVVGSGAAGLSAALEAADAGCKVILLEKKPSSAEILCVQAGFTMLPIQKSKSSFIVTDSPEFFYQQLEESAHGRAIRPYAKYLLITQSTPWSG